MHIVTLRHNNTPLFLKNLLTALMLIFGSTNSYSKA